MAQVNIHEAKTRFSQLVAQVEAGEEVVVARAGRPVVKLVRIEPAADGVDPRWPNRRPGRLKGKITYTDDWDSDAVNDEIAASMHGLSVQDYKALEARLRREWEESQA